AAAARRRGLWAALESEDSFATLLRARDARNVLAPYAATRLSRARGLSRIRCGDGGRAGRSIRTHGDLRAWRPRSARGQRSERVDAPGRSTRWPALHRMELRLLLAGAYRAGQGGLARRPDETPGRG